MRSYDTITERQCRDVHGLPSGQPETCGGIASMPRNEEIIYGITQR